MRLAFRLSSRAEYHQSVVVRAHHQHRLRQQQAAEQAASPNARLGSPTTDSLFGEGAIAVDESATVSSSDSQMSSTHPSRAELEIPIWDYRFSTCGLEEVEVLGETSEALSLIRDQLRDLSTKLGVGFMGNTVKITDIVSFLADKV